MTSCILHSVKSVLVYSLRTPPAFFRLVLEWYISIHLLFTYFTFKVSFLSLLTKNFSIGHQFSRTNFQISYISVLGSFYRCPIVSQKVLEPERLTRVYILNTGKTYVEISARTLPGIGNFHNRKPMERAFSCN